MARPSADYRIGPLHRLLEAGGWRTMAGIALVGIGMHVALYLWWAAYGALGNLWAWLHGRPGEYRVWGETPDGP